jgi:UDP-glucose:(heptosyl)LPS alpha-1,3-glucosyltransferase
MRVALVFRHFNLKGSLERDSVLAARGLADLGVEVDCFCDPETRVEIPGVRFRDVRPLARSRARIRYAAECLSFAARATHLLRRERNAYDVIDVRGTSAWEHDVVRVHGVTRAETRRWVDGPGRAYRWAGARSTLSPLLRPQVGVTRAIERRQFRPGIYRRVIAVTERVRRDLVEVHGVPPELVDVLPPPIDIEAFSAPADGAVRRELSIGPDETLLLFVGHDFDRKGLGDAIAALAGLPAATHLVVVGDGDVTRAQAAVQRAGIEGRVHFVGRTAEPQRYYGAANLLVLPTRQEPWGIPLIEAMAAGVPTLTTSVAGAAPLVESLGTGVVLADPTVPELRAAIAGLIADPDRRARMSIAGLREISRFGVAEQARQTVAIYERVLSKGNNGRSLAATR